MRFFILRALFVMILVPGAVISFAQTKTNVTLLKEVAVQQAQKEKVMLERLQTLAKQKGWDLVVKRKNGGLAILAGIDEFGMPLYLSTENNIIAAATIGTNKLWPGGSTGLNLSGASNSVKDKLGLWDGGKVRSTHVEIAGRVIQKDNSPTISDHSTHVAGTMIAKGVNPLAKGMAFGQQELVAFDYSGDNSEMMIEAPNLLLSNHSYGFNAGWVYNDGQDRWEFYGAVDAVEDYKFGYYSSGAQLWDSIAYNAPYYLIVKSAGNSRDMNGPAVGQPYFRFNAAGTMASAGNRPAGISSNDAFDILSTNANAKNILVVGAVNPLSAGYNKPEDVTLSTFSSWGPTDDGRIKPDVVGDGVNLLSSTGATDNSYDIYSGTSMAAPTVSGSLLLLQEYYAQLHGGTFMRAATLKGLAVHTTDEAGSAPGPDYQFGYGLLNMQKAAAVITSNNTQHLIQEGVLNNGSTVSIPVIATGNGTISATLSWTDPKSSVELVANALNNSAKKLVNDLDIVIKKGATTYSPWILTPSVPTAPAARGNNTLDNIEKLELTDVIPGETYTIEITHKGTLERASQAYSLIVSGVGGQTICASAATSSAGARIDSVSFGTIQQKNVAGCTTYNSYTSLTGNLEPGTTIPIFIRLNSCDATSVDKMLKVFLDINNDGDFTDAGETLATSGVINGNGDFTGNITIPLSLTSGTYSVLRIVMQETNSAAAITPCGSYTRGETQDYRVLMVKPGIDFSVSEVVAPISGTCASGQQYVSVRIRNSGTADKKNIPVTAVVKQGATTVATLTATYTDTIYANTDEVYTFQNPVTLVANTAYSITASTSFAGDQNPGNNQTISSFTTAARPADPTGTAVVCGTTNIQLTATPVTGTELFNWYTTPTATVPVASGATTTTTTVSPNYYLSANETTKLGPANKLVYTEGGYNIFFNNLVKITTSRPVTMETARLYIGTSGKITFILRQIVTENADGSYNYFPISTTTIDVYATSPTTPVMGAQNNNPLDLGAIYRLGIDFPVAANYYLIIQCENGASIFRNNNITTNPYPATVPDVISITSNSATDATDPVFYQKFWYFFYDVAVKVLGCPTNRVTITPTTLTTPVITISGNVLSSNVATGNQWRLNGNPITGATNQTYTATESGVYTTQISSGNCQLTSNEISFIATAVPNLDPSEIALTVSPNPAPAGQFRVQLQTRTRSDLQINLMSTNGQKVYSTTMPDFSGRLQKDIKPANLMPGVYYLQVIHDRKMYIRKIVVVH